MQPEEVAFSVTSRDLESKWSVDIFVTFYYKNIQNKNKAIIPYLYLVY